MQRASGMVYLFNVERRGGLLVISLLSGNNWLDWDQLKDQL